MALCSGSNCDLRFHVSCGLMAGARLKFSTKSASVLDSAAYAIICSRSHETQETDKVFELKLVLTVQKKRVVML